MTSRSEGTSILDILVAAVVLLCAAALFAIPLRAGEISAMYGDLGGELPIWTTLALAPYVPPLLGLLVIACAALAFWQWKHMIRRKLLLCSALIVGAGSILGVLYALYLPIFEIAGNISSE